MILVTSDLHLTDNPRDRYRFDIFPWISAQKPVYVFILGDLTDQKDRHSSTLVNTLIYNLKLIKCPVYILRGNHDCVDPKQPFFGFLDELETVTFVTFPSTNLNGVYFIPHQRTQAEFDAVAKDAPGGAVVMAHQTFDGAISETGGRIAGFKWPAMRSKPRLVLAGDIHKPQSVSLTKGLSCTYVGAPYHVRFGDNYTPRVMILNHNFEHIQDVRFPAPKKSVLRVRDATEILNSGLSKNDQVKIIVELTREEVIEWPKHKEQVLKACQECGLEVYGVELKVNALKADRIKQKVPTGKTREDYFEAFCVSEAVPSQIREVGLKFLTGGSDETESKRDRG